MFRAFRTRALSAGLVALALAAAGCGSSGTTSSTGGSGGSTATKSTLIIANAVKVDTLDPAQNSVNESIWLDQNIYSRLLQPNSTGTGLLPDLATSWDISKNGLTYTFHLRTDADFSNGTPVTAQDAVYSIDRARNLSGGWGFLLTAVKKVSAPDTHTVVIKLSPAACAAAGRPGHVRLLGHTGKPGQGPGQGVLPAPDRQRAIYGHVLQPGQRGRPGPQRAFLRHHASRSPRSRC